MAEMPLLDYVRDVQTTRANSTLPFSLQNLQENSLPHQNNVKNVVPVSLQNPEALKANKFINTADMEKIKLMLKGVQPFNRG